jgi:hypothetical protein
MAAVQWRPNDGNGSGLTRPDGRGRLCVEYRLNDVVCMLASRRLVAHLTIATLCGTAGADGMTVRSGAEAPATTQSQLKTTTKARPATAAPRHKKAGSFHPAFTPWQPKPAAPLPALVVTPPAPPRAEVPERLRAVVAAVKSGGVVVLNLTVSRPRRTHRLDSPACNIHTIHLLQSLCWAIHAAAHETRVVAPAEAHATVPVPPVLAEPSRRPQGGGGSGCWRVRSSELLRGSGGCVEQDWVLGDGKEGRDVVLALASSTRLRQLALCNTNITTVHTPTLLGAALPSLTALQVLDLSCNHLGAAGAHSLAAGLGQLPALTELNLRATALHDAGALELARALVSMASLKSLILRNTQLHVQGASVLAAALPSLTALEALDLGNNRRV